MFVNRPVEIGQGTQCIYPVATMHKRSQSTVSPNPRSTVIGNPEVEVAQHSAPRAYDTSNVRPQQLSREAIAICGIGLRLPGGIRTTEEFWRLLIEGKDARGRMTVDRLASPGVHDRKSPPVGYYLDENLCDFDPSTFNLSRSELEQADPQQRKLLQVTRECLENAGEANYRGKNVGCYVGTFGDDWMQMLSKDDQFAGGIDFRGTIDAMLANRLSYEFDLRGPR